MKFNKLIGLACALSVAVLAVFSASVVDAANENYGSSHQELSRHRCEWSVCGGFVVTAGSASVVDQIIPLHPSLSIYRMQPATRQGSRFAQAGRLGASIFVWPQRGFPKPRSMTAITRSTALLLSSNRGVCGKVSPGGVISCSKRRETGSRFARRWTDVPRANS